MRTHHRHYVAPLPGEPDLFSMPSLTMPPVGMRLDMLEPPAQPVDMSLAAAAKIVQHTARIREAVYLYIKACGGATAGEITEKLGLNPSTVRPRLRELEGTAPWAKGKLPVRIQRSPEKRRGMRCYVAL